ncbi:MAG TPA: copper oxidase [Haliangiales bacterium]|nr:copper oxidase [Haliangiales bacterium]
MSGISRRDLLLTGAALGGAALARGNARAQEHDHEHEHEHHHPAPPPKATPGARTAPRATPTGWRQNGSVTTPNGVRAPWNVVDGVKVFHLVAEPVRHELVDGLTVECWGYNGRTPGPTIEVTEGDRCRFYVQNRLPEATSIHWHGVFLPNGMDGVVGLTQKAIGPGETYVYEFTFTRPGTFMYHPHADEMTQIAFGMMGMIVVHPRNRPARRVRDYAILLHEWKVVPGARRPDPLAMNDFNVLTMNSKAYPATEPLVAELGDLVRIRLGNLSPMDHHPIHIHGHAFRVVETDGGAVPAGARVPETTAFVPVGTVRVIEFVADAPGDWPFHCHMTHHVMNQMGHDSPILVGADLDEADARIRKLVPGYMSMGQGGMGGMGEMGMDVPANSVPMKGAAGPFGFIDMGGMFTIVKIRERLSGEPGWYRHPAGTVAVPATEAQLRRDGVEVDG